MVVWQGPVSGPLLFPPAAGRPFNETAVVHLHDGTLLSLRKNGVCALPSVDGPGERYTD